MNYMVCASADDGSFAEVVLLEDVDTSKDARKQARHLATELGWPAGLTFNAERLEEQS